MAFRIQIRRDTSEKWLINDPILLEGEFGYETDTALMKIGDGVTPWNSLEYWNPGGGTGGTGGYYVEVQKNGTTVLEEAFIINFEGDFNVVATTPTKATVTYTGGTGGTGTSSSSYVPYFSVVANMVSGNFSSFSSSKGPDGQPLTGPAWNYSLSNIGNNLTITHNESTKPIGLATYGINSSNVFVKSPIQVTTGGFSLASNLAETAFTVYGLNSANTGASLDSTVEIIWTFGATL